MRPKVSVVIGTHNHAHFLPECLRSVKEQDYDDYEVIVVDNGSTDDTKNVVDKLAWGKLRYSYQQDTGSIAGSRNTGIHLAKGEYIAFLDSDDLWYKQKLERVMKIFNEHPGIDLITHDLFIRKNGRLSGIGKVGPGSKNMFKKLLFYENCIAGSATTVKRDILIKIGGFDERKEFMNAEDYEAWMKIAYLKKNFYFLNECLGEYRIHNSNVSHNLAVTCPNEINVIKKHFKNYKSNNLVKYLFYGIVIGEIYFRLGRKHISTKQYEKGIINILKSFLYSPLFIHIFKVIINFIILRLKNIFEFRIEAQRSE